MKYLVGQVRGRGGGAFPSVTRDAAAFVLGRGSCVGVLVGLFFQRRLQSFRLLPYFEAFLFFCWHAVHERVRSHVRKMILQSHKEMYRTRHLAFIEDGEWSENDYS